MEGWRVGVWRVGFLMCFLLICFEISGVALLSG